MPPAFKLLFLVAAGSGVIASPVVPTRTVAGASLDVRGTAPTLAPRGTDTSVHTYLPSSRITPSWDDDDPSFGHQDGPVWTRIYSDLPIQTGAWTKTELEASTGGQIPVECAKAKSDGLYVNHGTTTNVKAYSVVFKDCPSTPLIVCYETGANASPLDQFLDLFTVVPPPLRAGWDIVALLQGGAGCGCTTSIRPGGNGVTMCAGMCGGLVPVVLHEAGNMLAGLGKTLTGGAAGSWYDDPAWIAAASADKGVVVADRAEYLADLFKEVVIFDKNFNHQAGGGLHWLATGYTPALNYDAISHQVDFMEKTMFPDMLVPSAACGLNKLPTSRPLPSMTARA